MRVKSLKINNLRNIQATSLQPAPRLNYFFGANGAGKTTVLESLVVLAKGRSFRSGKISSLIGPRDDAFVISARIDPGGQRPEARLGLQRDAASWQGRINGENVAQIGDLGRYLPLVVLEPNSHLLVSGPPDTRRRYLDWSAFHVEHTFLSLWRRYERAIRQRNAALRAGSLGTVKSLDAIVANHGEALDQARRGEFTQLQQTLEETLPRLSADLPEIDIRYRRGWTGESLLGAIEAATPADLERGATGPGPHRADVILGVGGRAARDSLSRGEQKLVAAALLLAQGQRLASIGAMPVLLLDDLASEFDSDRRENVRAAALDIAAQVWITGTEAPEGERFETNEYTVFHVEHGMVEKRSEG